MNPLSYDMTERATATFHSTASQAAQIGKLAKVNQLLLGHYSARYKDVSLFLNEAKQVLEATQLAQEGIEIALEE